MKKLIRVVSVTALTALLAACATSKSVDEKIAASQATTNQRIESVSSQVEDLQQKQQQTDVKLEQLSQSAQEALKRAQEAGVLAKGKVVFEQSFSEDRIKFKLDSYELDAAAKTALDEFAARVKGLTDQYFVEIQGHTDDTGGERYNEELARTAPTPCVVTSRASTNCRWRACRRSRTATPCRSSPTNPATDAPPTAAWCWWFSNRTKRTTQVVEKAGVNTPAFCFLRGRR